MTRILVIQHYVCQFAEKFVARDWNWKSFELELGTLPLS
jgi:hypothetical protein